MPPLAARLLAKSYISGDPGAAAALPAGGLGPDGTFDSLYPDVAVPNLSLTDYVLQRVDAAAPGAIALIDGPSGRTTRYDQLRPMVQGCAAGLAARGFARGDVLAILSPNIPEYVIAFHAVASLGGVVTTLNPLYTAAEVSHQLTDASASYLLTVGVFADKAREAVGGTGVKELIIFDAPTDDATTAPVPTVAFKSLLAADLAAGPREPKPPIRPGDVVAIPYSSGTSGMPKGVELTHGNLVANLQQITYAHLQLSAEDTLIGVLPFFHICTPASLAHTLARTRSHQPCPLARPGTPAFLRPSACRCVATDGMIVILNAAIARLSRVVSMPKFDPAAFLSHLKQHDVTVAHVAPPIVGFLAKHPAVDGVLPLPRLKELFSGAAPLGGELAEAAKRRLGVQYVRQGYGMTELSPASHIVPYRLSHAKGATVGELLPSLVCKILDTETGVPVGVGERGEVCVKGPNVMKGYLNKPEATAATVDRGGFLRTGDVGIIDHEGCTSIVDRVKELIKVKGFQVAPAELEALLQSFDEVADAAVIGVADEKAGELPKAYVVKQKGHERLTAEVVMQLVKGRVASYKEIAYVEFVTPFPSRPPARSYAKSCARWRTSGAAVGPTPCRDGRAATKRCARLCV